VLIVALQLSGSSAFVTATHVPVAHVWHVPAHAVLQHIPSRQFADAHCVPLVHPCPLLNLHVPAASQVLVPVHVSGSSTPVTATHAPVAQLWHVPLHAPGQHAPSAQKPDAHVPAPAHACPIFDLHTPVPSQVLGPVQVSASSAPFTAAHAPAVPARLHAWHVPHAAAPQHTVSTQKPDAHVAPPAHVWPTLALHAPLASHVLVPVHVSGSSAPFTAAHVPCDPTTLHAWHVPQLPAAQHTPSTQFADAHVVPPAHVCPFFERQLPEPSQVLVPPHAPSFVPSPTGQHAPRCEATLHA
jgi:hypothetical protein